MITFPEGLYSDQKIYKFFNFSLFSEAEIYLARGGTILLSIAKVRYCSNDRVSVYGH